MNLIYTIAAIFTLTYCTNLVIDNMRQLTEVTIKHELCVTHKDFGGTVVEPCQEVGE